MDGHVRAAKWMTSNKDPQVLNENKHTLLEIFEVDRLILVGSECYTLDHYVFSNYRHNRSHILLTELDPEKQSRRCTNQPRLK